MLQRRKLLSSYSYGVAKSLDRIFTIQRNSKLGKEKREKYIREIRTAIIDLLESENPIDSTKQVYKEVVEYPEGLAKLAIMLCLYQSTQNEKYLQKALAVLEEVNVG